MKKECVNCKQEKDHSEFYPCKNSVDGVGTVCRDCTKICGQNYRQSLVGLIKKLYRNQKQASVKRNHSQPNYTEEQFMIWVITQHNFQELYSNWVDSGYLSKLKPSGDRLDDYKPYTFENLRLVTWGENEQKARDDVKNGINNKKSKGCVQITLDGEVVAEYHSLSKAARITNSDSAGISSCCQGKQNTHNGFIWKYTEGEK